MSLRSPEELPAFSLLSVLATIRRQWLWMVGSTLVGIALTVFFTLRQRPVYEAHATLQLAEQKSPLQGTDVLAAMSAPSTIETEMEIIRSRSVAEDVVDTLGLRVRIAEPKGEPTHNLFGLLRAARETPPGSYVVERDPAAFSVTTPDGHALASTYDSSIVVNGLEVQALPLSKMGPRRIVLSVRPRSDAAEDLRGGLRVTRPQQNAGIVSVAYQSTDPALAASLVNDISNAYIARRTETQRQQYRAAVDFLEGQVTTIGGELTVAEGKLEEFRRAHSLIDPEAQATDEVKHLADLRVQREELDAQRSALWDLVRRSRQPAESASDWTAFVGSPALGQNQALTALVVQLSSLEAERARLMTWRTAADPDVTGLLRTIGVLRARLATLATSSLQGLDDQTRLLDQTLARSDARIGKVPEVQLQYARLRRQVDLDTQLYTMLQTRLKESQISEASEIANVQLVDPAVVPASPLAARRVFNLLFGCALALLCGIIVAVARESNDTSVRSREEVVRLTDLPLLATIPRMDLNGNRKELALQIEDRLVIRHSPRSPAAEAYRALRTNVAFATNGSKKHIKTLVVTSPEPMDGKTTTAVNLAITLAEQGLNVILIEADQRRPVLHKVLHTERTPGLSDLLAGMAPLERVARTIPLSDQATGSFTFIPAGHHAPNPAELLGSPAMRELISRLGEQFDQVVIDTPPLCVVTDAAVLGTQADGVLIVARMGATHAEALRQSVEEMRGLGAKIVGTVLTDVNQREDRYGYRYGYYQYYEETGNGHEGNGGNGKKTNGRAKAGKRV
jgi:capsular exopolysaccharide synthesis family protein